MASRGLLLTASVGCALTVIDANLIGIVLPSIARDFGASFSEIAWMVSAFMLSFSALLLPAGSVADRYGRRRVFLAGIAAFGCGALLCAIAPSAPLLTAARAVQGAAAAFLLSPALAILGNVYHSGPERDRAWAIWGAIMGLTMLASPLLGGVLVGWLGWRAAFFVMLPICATLAARLCGRVAECGGPAARLRRHPALCHDDVRADVRADRRAEVWLDPRHRACRLRGRCCGAARLHRG
jgi:MFS family permease